MRTEKMSRRNRWRMVGAAIAALFLAVVYIGRLVNMQLVNGESYMEEVEKTFTRTVSIEAGRGEIVDCYGRPLVISEAGFAVQFDKVTWDEERQNDVIARLLDLIPEEQCTYLDSIPLGKTAPYSVVWPEDADKRKTVTAFLELLDLTEQATGREVLAALRERYDIPEEFSDAAARAVAGVRYAIEKTGFSLVLPFSFASGVSVRTVTILREQYLDYPGVEIVTVPVRSYVDGTVAPHVIGTIGAIYKDEADTYINAGYALSDKVGKDGIEKLMESYLHGTSGTKTIEQDRLGRVTAVTVTEDPQPGSNIVTTIDSELQLVAQESLASTIQSISEKGQNRGNASGYDANAGAVVVLDVETAKVRAMASYPTYDLTEYYSNYTELASDPLKPLFNRAIAGGYPPGSTFKMATALSALVSGAVTVTDTVVCRGIYTYYSGYDYYCWVYSDYGTSHGDQNVRNALKNSCNCYFYEVGRLMGIDTLNEWCRRLGIGEKTGVGLAGESAGVLAGPDYRENFGQQWYAGDTLTASIGQSDNLLTPIQLANYVATVVNGGVRRETSVVDSVKSYDYGSTVLELSGDVVDDLGISEEIYTALMEGMRSVTEDGTASSVFADYPIAVGGKTGTASAASGTAHGVFVAFAPYEDPEIVVAVIVEHGAHGSSVAPVARDIFDKYFADKEARADRVTGELTLLS